MSDTCLTHNIIIIRVLVFLSKFRNSLFNIVPGSNRHFKKFCLSLYDRICRRGIRLFGVLYRHAYCLHIASDIAVDVLTFFQMVSVVHGYAGGGASLCWRSCLWRVSVEHLFASCGGSSLTMKGGGRAPHRATSATHTAGPSSFLVVARVFIQPPPAAHIAIFCNCMSTTHREFWLQCTHSRPPRTGKWWHIKITITATRCVNKLERFDVTSARERQRHVSHIHWQKQIQTNNRPPSTSIFMHFSLWTSLFHQNW